MFWLPGKLEIWLNLGLNRTYIRVALRQINSKQIENTEDNECGLIIRSYSLSNVEVEV